MSKTKSFLYFLTVISSLATLFYGFAMGWYSYIILWFVFLFGSIVFFKQFYKKETNYIIPLFLGIYSIYTLYMNITNVLYVKNPSTDFFMMVDSMKFWKYTDYPLYSFSDIFKYFFADLNYTSRYALFSLINLFFSFFSQLIDENNILVQKLQSVWIGAFSIPFIYLTFREYFNQKKSFNYSLFFGVFSFVCIYSIVFNRDPHVYLMYVLGTYLVVTHKRNKNLYIKLGVLLILTAGFRLEHGLFFLMFIVGYVYIQSKRDKNKIVLLIMMIPIALLAMGPFLFSKYQDNTEMYQEQIDRVDRSEASAGAFFSKLPPGAKQIFMGINSQVAPAVPFWRTFSAKYNGAGALKHPQAGYFNGWRIMEGVAAVVWLYVIGFIIAGVYHKKFKFVPIELRVILFIGVLLILAASSSINVRRIYCVYPALFITSMYFYNLLSKRQRKQVLNFTTVGLIVIYGLYVSIKGF